MKKSLRRVLLILPLALLSLGAAVYLDFRAVWLEPLAVPADGARLEVPAGVAIEGVSRSLSQRELMRSSFYLAIYARLTGAASKIKAGEYLIAPGTHPAELLDQMVKGQVIRYSLTIVEGWTFRQMLAAVHAHGELEHTLQGLDDGVIMARLGRPDAHPEGRFFPDTYFFSSGTTDLAFLKRAMDTMDRRLQQTWNQRVDDLPLKDPYEALILASIIEKETGLAGERREIAGVFTRRLRIGMRLQTDPTVIYGLGEFFDGDLRRRDLVQDTPYNTYVHHGLPPTPIALPGAESLAAAVDPAPGDALYFVADGSGGHVFSANLQDHNRAVRRYQLKRSEN
jgi:UPF0755 protein